MSTSRNSEFENVQEYFRSKCYKNVAYCLYFVEIPTNIGHFRKYPHFFSKMSAQTLCTLARFCNYVWYLLAVIPENSRSYSQRLFVIHGYDFLTKRAVIVPPPPLHTPSSDCLIHRIHIRNIFVEYTVNPFGLYFSALKSSNFYLLLIY